MSVTDLSGTGQERGQKQGSKQGCLMSLLGCFGTTRFFLRILEITEKSTLGK